MPKIYSSGPFRPTEIPSPIFGFNRPKETVVEYELSNFSTGSPFGHEIPVINNKTSKAIGDSGSITPAATLDVEHEQPNSMGDKERIRIEGTVFPIKIEENQTLLNETVLPQSLFEYEGREAEQILASPVHSEAVLEHETELELELEQEPEHEPEQEKELEIEPKHEPEQEKELEIEPKHEPEQEKELEIEPKHEPEQEKELEIEPEHEPEQEKELEIEPEHEPESDTEQKYENENGNYLNEVETSQTEVEIALVEIAASLIEEKLPSNEHSDIVIDDNIDHLGLDQIEIVAEESTAVNNENVLDQSEPEQPKRTHLPFNVMMLKQDRQKWEERQQQRKEDQSTSVQPVLSEPVERAAASIDPSSTEIYANSEVGNYEFPTFQLLNPPIVVEMDTEWVAEQENVLNQTLENFNVGAKVVNVTQGPAVTRFEVQPEPGVKVNKVTNLTDDIKLSLAARDIRIEAPIPGKHTIGIEVPNQKSRPVQISEIIQSKVFLESSSPLTAVLGLDISGKPIVTDLKKMPHGLIAGATGSGKSVCINTFLISLLYKASPEDLKLMLIDPKMVELAPYNRIPHLVSPVITDVKAATAALKWAVDEMERRYELFAHTGVRDINKFNELAMQYKRYSDKLPYIVIIIDELADLMMMSPADVEEAICRIAQKARACGIHLIIATQRPSVDVITGLIKANIPTRIAFSVSSQVDSRTIIDIGGAEKLLGRGDMLFLENGSSKPVRLQGTFVSDEEIDLVVAHVREQRDPDYLFEQDELLKKAHIAEEEDELFYEACEFVVDQGSASTSSLQRRFKIGYNRAARLMEMMEQQGYISSSKGSKPRDVLITATDLESIHETGNKYDND
ncbi:DNA translocase FtsK [Bacillus sp. EB600]|nr:DNA translocase FtsK [Bacillus sp. EB600]